MMDTSSIDTHGDSDYPTSSQVDNGAAIPTHSSFCSSNSQGESPNSHNSPSLSTTTGIPIRVLPNRLWIRRDVDYSLDMSYEDRIWNRFVSHVAMLRENRTYESDMSDDAFYFSYRPVPVHDIDVLRGSEDLLERMSCRRLRTMSLQLLEYAACLNVEIENFIRMDKSGLSEEVCLLIDDNILRKKAILGLANTVRNYVGGVILAGEKCHNYIEELNAIASKDIVSMNKRLRRSDEEADL